MFVLGISATKSNLREALFRIAISLKGLDGVPEIGGGPIWFLRAAVYLTRNELVEDHRDFVANLLLNAARRLSPGTEHFSAAYFWPTAS